MRAAHRMIIGATLCMVIGLAGCTSTGSSSGTNFSYKNITVAGGSTMAGEGHTVLFKGSPLSLSGTGIKVGDPLREANLTQGDLSLVTITDTKGKGKVRINKAGCLDRCDEGPIVVVYPDDVWYTYIDRHDIDEIIDSHVLHGRVVDRLKI